jgi:uncharacterized damage-inducible protein DinB
MFRSIDDFLTVWREESTNTGRVMERLTDASLRHRMSEASRTLGELAWHVTVSHRSILGRTGLAFQAATKDLHVPERASEICARYVAGAAAVGGAVEKQWTDATLRVRDDIYGLSWTRGRTLFVLVVHEIHHRAQMTVLMRQVGLTLPALYGPSADEH